MAVARCSGTGHEYPDDMAAATRPSVLGVLLGVEHDDQIKIPFLRVVINNLGGNANELSPNLSAAACNINAGASPFRSELVLVDCLLALLALPLVCHTATFVLTWLRGVKHPHLLTSISYYAWDSDLAIYLLTKPFCCH